MQPEAEFGNTKEEDVLAAKRPAYFLEADSDWMMDYNPKNWLAETPVSHFYVPDQAKACFYRGRHDATQTSLVNRCVVIRNGAGRNILGLLIGGGLRRPLVTVCRLWKNSFKVKWQLEGQTHKNTACLICNETQQWLFLSPATVHTAAAFSSGGK